MSSRPKLPGSTAIGIRATYLEFPMVELPARRDVISQVSFDSDAFIAHSHYKFVAGGVKFGFVFFFHRSRHAAGNNYHLNVGDSGRVSWDNEISCVKIEITVKACLLI